MSPEKDAGRRFDLRVTSDEVAGPPGRGSRAETEARIPRPESRIKLVSPQVRVLPPGTGRDS